MIARRKKRNNGRVRGRGQHFDPNEVFLDSSNLPEFNTHQFEGRIEKPIGKAAVWMTGGFFALILIAYLGRVGELQIVRGEEFRMWAEENRLEHSVVFAPRGILYDRTGEKLAWNTISSSASTTSASTTSTDLDWREKKAEDGEAVNDFLSREYSPLPGLAHALGYVSYPAKDSSGVFYETNIRGMDGAEKQFSEILSGHNGLKLREVDARGALKSESVIDPPFPGEDVYLSIDSRVQSELHKNIVSLAERVDFKGGAGIIMDITTGEILAMTSYPEYHLSDMTEGNDEKIREYQTDSRTPFLNRIVQGLYTPGSIVKPFMALGALTEGIITPEKEIFSGGSLTVPNPYFPDKPTIFKDWRAHGWTDMRHAIAVSSDVYFYTIGGGFGLPGHGGQQGLGIARIEKYMKMFGFGAKTGIAVSGEKVGTVPNPEWKKENFDGEPWLLGNTYHTAIGQYGFQVTPLQIVRAVGSIANGGMLVTPTLEKLETEEKKEKDFGKNTIPISPAHFRIVQEGMRLSVEEGTTKGLLIPSFAVAGKTGTAELGVSKERINSWVMGFFPYDDPRYAFAVVMEKGPRQNLTGATFVMRQTLDWMVRETPEYIK